MDIHNWIKKGKGICESCIASDKKWHHSFEEITTDVGHVKSQKSPTNNTSVESHHDNKKRNNNKDNHHHHHHTDRPERIRVLVAESNHDLRYLYQAYLDSFGLDIEIVGGEKACLNRFLKT